MQIFAHRGYSGKYPENTMAAFRAVLNYAVDGVELDVHETKDGHLVVIHDELINRTTNGKGFVKDLTLDEIQSYDAGSWFNSLFKGERVPTLEEVLKLFQNTSYRVNIELKSDVFPYYGMDMKVIKLVEELDMTSQVILSSFDHETLQRVSQVASGIEIAPLFMTMILNPWTYTKTIPATAMHISGYYLFREAVQMAVEDGATIRVYTLNTAEHMQLVKETGAQAMFTDEIEVALSWRASKR